MAALCPGVQYGLSSQESFGDSKELIFVKLTDSALRTIEEYLRNQTSHTRPTIQFLGNEGHFSFPTQNGSTKFNISVSSTSDMEGPGGSFECLQQSPRGSLTGLGPIPHKIRVAANDDVYDQTRHRMSMLEENAKNKSTREIEMNRTDIGRKVKVKQVPGRPIPPPPPRREMPPSRDLIGGGGGSSSSIASNKSSYPPTLPSSLNSSSNKPSLLHNGNSSSNGLSSNGLGSNHVSSSKPQTNKPSLPEIARRPIKERMIHLLALRPYKKPELYDRLVREGLREKKAMMAVLKQIAHLKDNCYHLNRAMFNDVHEDWPFYNESERQILKRRKPENLTPPGSSDGGSSGSGHSPTSTHPGSPPPVTSSSKRPGYYECADGSQSKRQRISHYRKPSEQPPSYRSPAESNSQRRPMTDSRDASNMNPRSRESPTPPPPTSSSSAFAAMSAASTMNMNNGYHHHTTAASPPASSNGYGGSATSAAAAVTSAATAVAISAPATSMLNDDEDLHHSHHHASNHALSAAPAVAVVSSNRKRAACDSHSSAVSSYERQAASSTPPLRGGSGGDVDGGTHAVNGGGGGSARYKVSSSTPSTGGNSSVGGGGGGGGASNRVARVSPDSQWDRCNVSTNSLSGKSWKKDDKTAGSPDYLHEYTGIKNKEQRKRYKSDFNANYTEYRELHGVVERVSKRFALLNERLKKESNASRYKEIKNQIVREYEISKKDCEHQTAKQRFQYLHDKLSHIKRLVTEYDQMVADSRY